MREYTKLLCKKIIKRKSNVILILTSLCILGIVLVLNVSMQSEFRDKLIRQIEVFDEEIKYKTNMLTAISGDSDKYSLYQASIEGNETFKKDYKDLVTFYDAKEWDAFYEKYRSIIKEETQIFENSRGDSEDTAFKSAFESYDKELAHIDYLDEHDLPYDDLNFPIAGLSFLTSMSQTALPILVLICCIYILSQVFTIDYYEHIDVSETLPMGRKKKELTKVLVGIGFSIFIYLLVLITTLVVSICISSTTGFDYPFMIQDGITKAWKAVSLLSLFPKWFALGILFYICVSLLIYLVSKLIKDEVPLFLSTICVILTLAYLPSMSSLLMPIAQYLPTTYLRLVKIVSGSIANQYSNDQITFMCGVLVLSVSIFALGIITYICMNRKQQKR